MGPKFKKGQLVQIKENLWEYSNSDYLNCGHRMDKYFGKKFKIKSYDLFSEQYGHSYILEMAEHWSWLENWLELPAEPISVYED